MIYLNGGNDSPMAVVSGRESVEFYLESYIDCYYATSSACSYLSEGYYPVG